VVVIFASPGIFASQWFLPLVGISCVVFVFLDVLYSWFYISSFIFSLDEQYIFVRKGVIAHNYTIIPYENVQDIHVVQSITDRIFGVWSVIIFTATATAAGSDNILGLKKEDAEVFKEAVFAKIKEAKHVTD
jgi:membrane protein YdbS with pleckstrin-like domain